MTLVLVRHARAGERGRWQGDDRLRPLDERGAERARRLPGLLAGIGVDRIVSSPYVRCVQTVEPLAAALGLAVETAEELAEERQALEGPAFLRALLAADALACVHGGIEAALGIEQRFRKGAVWVFRDALDEPVEL